MDAMTLADSVSDADEKAHPIPAETWSAKEEATEIVAVAMGRASQPSTQVGNTGQSFVRSPRNPVARSSKTRASTPLPQWRSRTRMPRWLMAS
jgi:hypothetical protein